MNAIAGANEGRAAFAVTVADLTVAVVSASPGLKLGTQGAMLTFEAPETTSPDMTLRASWGDLTRRKGGATLFDSGGVWRLQAQAERHCFSFTAPPLGRTPYKVAVFDQQFASGEVFLHQPYFNAETPLYPLEYPLDELVMTRLLAEGRGVELHSCGVIDAEGNGYLFAGHSGAGKSTMARLWQEAGGCLVLSDDRTVLRAQEGRLWMYGTPWHGTARLASPARAPLRRVYILRHGSKNELVPLGRAETVGQLFARSFPPLYSASAMDFTLGFLEQVAGSVPVRELRFLPDRSVVAFILREQDRV